MSRYAISDIHGCVNTFKSALQQINFSKEDELYLLGDYIDRGPDSKAVIDYIWDLQNRGHHVFCLKGNHEEMMLEGLTKFQTQSAWKKHGGRETLASFEATEIGTVPYQYMEWMHKLPHFIEVDNYILVHAGLNFKVNDPLDDKQGMLWSRHWYHEIRKDWLRGRIIVHGHTPINQNEVKASLSILDEILALNIDNGCVYDRPGQGQLCVFNMDTRELLFVPRDEG